MTRLRKDVQLAEVDDLMRRCLIEEQWLEDPQTNRLMGYGLGDVGVVNAKTEFAKALAGEGRTRALGVYLRFQPVGYFLVADRGPARKSIRFQLFLSPEARVAGVAHTALNLLKRRTLRKDVAYRLESEILAINDAAQRWLKHEGFTQEGFMKHAYWQGGKPYSTVLMRLSAPQWRKMRKQEVA